MRSSTVGYLICMAILCFYVLSAFIGCTSPLADASFSVQQEFHRTVVSFGLVAQDFSAKATIMADKKHMIQRKLQALELAMAYDRAKDADGNLVLTPEDFAELTALVIEGQNAVATSQSRWSRVSEGFRDTLQLLRTINTSTLTTAEAIHETEASIQVFTQKVIQTLGGLMAVAGVAL